MNEIKEEGRKKKEGCGKREMTKKWKNKWRMKSNRNLEKEDSQ